MKKIIIIFTIIVFNIIISIALAIGILVILKNKISYIVSKTAIGEDAGILTIKIFTYILFPVSFLIVSLLMYFIYIKIKKNRSNKLK